MRNLNSHKKESKPPEGKEDAKTEAPEAESPKTKAHNKLQSKTKKSLWVKAMDYLARRDHSEKELMEKLKNHYPMEEIKSTLLEMKSRGWILPPEELSKKVCENLHKKNKSHFFILNFLKEKGLPPVQRQANMERKKALTLVKNKVKDPSNRKQLISLLKNRNFDTNTIREVLNEVCGNSSGFY